MINPILVLTDINYTMPNHGPDLFSGLQLKVEPGERLAIVGGEAVGKSTLMRLMAGLIKPASGHILFSGQPLTTPPSQPGGIGLLFRDSASHFLIPVAQEEILLSMTNSGELERESKIAGFLELSGLPPQASTWSLAGLSAAQQARVAIASLLASQPRLILADEPGVCLDGTGEERLAALFKEQCAEKAQALVVFTSRLERAKRFADTLLYLSQGILSTTPFPNR
jgi:energy-coupling factor transporter ATP-binding protein EcfA2